MSTLVLDNATTELVRNAYATKDHSDTEVQLNTLDPATNKVFSLAVAQGFQPQLAAVQWDAIAAAETGSAQDEVDTSWVVLEKALSLLGVDASTLR